MTKLLLSAAAVLCAASAQAAAPVADLTNATKIINGCLPAAKMAAATQTPAGWTTVQTQIWGAQQAHQKFFVKLSPEHEAFQTKLKQIKGNLAACGMAYAQAVPKAEALLQSLQAQNLGPADQQAVQTAFNEYHQARLALADQLAAISDRIVEAHLKGVLQKYFLTDASQGK